MAVTDALITQRHEIESRLKERYIERDATIGGKSANLIRVVSGPRRAGKSFFTMHMLPQDGRFGYVNFDDERLAARDGDEIIAAVKEVFGAPEVLFLDEIQNLPNWELFVNRLQREGYHLFLTGSNSQLLSSELATHLTGRYLQTTLFPFSFKEVLRTRGTLITTAEKQAMLAQYIKNGGFPEVILKDLEAREYLSTLFDAVVYKDIVKRYRIR
jgi:predicted AAA+ superfamily ATPase